MTDKMAGPYIMARAQYPVIINFYRASDALDLNPVHTITLEAPLHGDELHAVEIPALRAAVGEPVRVVVTYGDGTSSRHNPLAGK